MINLILIILIALSLLVLLLLAARRGAGESPKLNTALPEDSDYRVRLPQRALLDRCLSPEDVEFVAVLKARPVFRLFLQERRRLTLCWLRQTRRESARLYSLHVRSVRHAAGLRPAAEAKLFGAVGLFIIVYALMVSTVWLYGPFRARRFLHSLQFLAGLLSDLGVRIANSISPAPLPQPHLGSR